MILQQENKTVTTNVSLGAEYFGVSQEDATHVLGILRDKLYSDKILAVIREYSCNAVDAHAEAGIPERPISVHLPYSLDPAFRVRDFGAGLSESDIYNVYCKYGKSTKRHSNLGIGQLGIGSKSGFAYTDQFTVTSWHDGQKSIYSAYIDETLTGKIALLSRTPMGPEDETGVEIALAAKTEDVASGIFRKKAKALFSTFAVYPDCALADAEHYPESPLGVVMTADNGIFSSLNEVTVEAKGDPEKYVSRSYYYYYERSIPMTIVMGGVPYPIAVSLPKGFSQERYELLAQTNVLAMRNIWNVLTSDGKEETTLLLGATVYHVNIGTFSVAASREALEDRGDLGEKCLSIATLRNTQAIARLIEMIEASNLNHRQVFEIYQVAMYQKALKPVWTALKERYPWVVQLLNRKFVDWSGYSDLGEVHASVEANRNRIYEVNHKIITVLPVAAFTSKSANQRLAFVVNDLTGKDRDKFASRYSALRKSVHRLDGKDLSMGDTWLIVNGREGQTPEEICQAVEDFKKKNRIAFLDTYKLSEVTTQRANRTRRSKASVKTRKLSLNDNTYFHASAISTAEDVSTVDTLENPNEVYVVTHRRSFVHGADKAVRAYSVIIGNDDSTVSRPEVDIHLVTQAEAKRVPDTWITLDDYLESHIAKWVSENNHSDTFEKLTEGRTEVEFTEGIDPRLKKYASVEALTALAKEAFSLASPESLALYMSDWRPRGVAKHQMKAIANRFSDEILLHVSDSSPYALAIRHDQKVDGIRSAKKSPTRLERTLKETAALYPGILAKDGTGAKTVTKYEFPYALFEQITRVAMIPYWTEVKKTSDALGYIFDYDKVLVGTGTSFAKLIADSINKIDNDQNLG